MLPGKFLDPADNRTGIFFKTVIVVYRNFYCGFIGIIENPVGNLEYFIVDTTIGKSNKWQQHQHQYSYKISHDSLKNGKDTKPSSISIY